MTTKTLYEDGVLIDTANAERIWWKLRWTATQSTRYTHDNNSGNGTNGNGSDKLGKVDWNDNLNGLKRKSLKM